MVLQKSVKLNPAVRLLEVPVVYVINKNAEGEAFGA